MGDPFIHSPIMRPLISLAVLLAALSLVVSACSDSSDGDEASTTTTTAAASGGSGEDLVFGSGELPETVPADFPFPDQAVVGSTLIDRTRGLTELVATYPAVVLDVVAFYEANLPAAGYTIVTSNGNDGAWDLEFEKGDLEGQIAVEFAGAAVSQGTIRMIQPSG